MQPGMAKNESLMTGGYTHMLATCVLAMLM